MRRRTVTILVLIAALALAACGEGDSTPRAGERQAADRGELEDFWSMVLGFVERGQFGREWEVLHPSQQSQVGRARWANCRDVPGFTVTRVRVLDTYDEVVEIPGTGETAESVAVTLEITVRQGRSNLTDRDTFHVFDVDGAWRHMVTDEVLRGCVESR